MDCSLEPRKKLTWPLLAGILGVVIATIGLAPSTALADAIENASDLQSGIVAVQEDASYPAQYNADVDKLANVTPVRLQNPWNDCWAFGATAAMESSLLATKLETNGSANFLSPRHLAYFAFKAHGEGAQSDEGMTPKEGESIYNLGNSVSTVIGTLAAGWGPALESSYPYKGAKGLVEYANNDENTPLSYSAEDDWTIDGSKAADTAGYQLKSAYTVGSTATFSDPNDKANSTYTLNAEAVNQTKDLVMSYGGVSVDYLSDHSNTAQNEEDDLHVYNSVYKEVNHTVEIVGWDDSYPRTNFTEHGTPDADGAWLCKNSWGSNLLGFPNHSYQANFNGYFWLSYYDRTISNITAYELTAANSSDYGTTYIDQYDYLGRRSEMTEPLFHYENEVRYANIFTAQQDQTVTHASLELFRNNTTSDITVYKLYDDAKNPQDGVLVNHQTTTTPIAGYYKVKLLTPLALKKGERYSIVETVKTDDKNYFIPIEAAATQSAKAYTQHAVINNGESWLHLGGDQGWVDATTQKEALEADCNTNTEVHWELGNVMVKGFATAYDDKYAVSTETQVMWRLYNSYSGEHLFTADAQERDSLVKVGWTDEGQAWTAPVKSKKPVYRLYNSYQPLGDHHYTTSKEEYDNLVKEGWTGEDVSWYSAGEDEVGLYRLYNPNAYSTGMTGAHHYTTSKEENDKLVEAGWKAEGTAWYGVFRYAASAA